MKDEEMVGIEVAHPLRSAALKILVEREASPVEVARQLGVDPSHLAYHVRILHDAGLIRLVEEVPKHGSIEHRYIGIVKDHPTSSWYENTPPAEVARRAYRTLCVLLAEANCGLSSSSFEDDHRLGRYPMKVDEVGEKELAAAFDTLDVDLQRIRRAAAKRLNDADEVGRPVTAIAGYFESPPPTSARS